MQLSGDDYRKITKALIDAFDTDSFAYMLRSYLSVRLDTITTEKISFTTIVRDTVNWAQREDRVEDLVAGAKKANPHNQQLQSLPDTFADSATNPAPAINWQPVIDELLPLLLPHVSIVQDRQTLLTEAYRGSEAWILKYIEIDGPPLTFAVNCLAALLDHGCYLLDHLIVVLRRRHGHAEQMKLDTLQSDIAALCREPIGQAAAGTVTRPAQRAADSAAPPLYLAYAPADAAFAQRLGAVLSQYGFNCNVRRIGEPGSAAWRDSSADGLTQAYAVLAIVGESTWQHPYTVVELLLARNKRKQIVTVQRGTANLPTVLASEQALVWDAAQPDTALDQLLSRLPSPPPGSSFVGWPEMPIALVRYAADLVHLSRFKLDELVRVVGIHYTPLHGRSRRETPRLDRSPGDQLRLPWQVAQQYYAHTPRFESRSDLAPEEDAQTNRFTDAVDELQRIRRAVLLGEPGAGKTTTLYRLAAKLIDAALLQRDAPVPFLISLGLWRDAEVSFAQFLHSQAGVLADGWAERLASGRVALLLDGLNEIPSDQQAEKYAAVDAFLAQPQHRQLMAIVTCREQDYPPERALRLDRVTVEPLDPVQVRDFAAVYLDPLIGTDTGDVLFWKLAGAEAKETYARFTAATDVQIDEPFHTFWRKNTLPTGVTWGWDFLDKGNNRYWTSWVQQRAEPADLLRLALNPYMLSMLLTVYMEYAQSLPDNRGQLFDRFVAQLLVREKLFGRDAAGRVVRRPEGDALLAALADLALDMQTVRAGEEGEQSAWTVIPATRAARLLSANQRKQAVSASLLTPGDEVHFTHQLLQEYFVAQAMRQRIFGTAADVRPLRATDIWSADRWWEPTNWEEATILLAGLYSDDCSDVVEWVADAQPEVAARCIVESGAFTPPTTLIEQRDLWLPRLTGDPTPQARAAVGRALGRIRLDDGTLLDNRPGVGIKQHRGIDLPDIAWGEVVPPGRYEVGGDAKAYGSFDTKMIPIDRPYQLAQYPVTVAQFDCFVQAVDVDDARWWASMPEDEKYRSRMRNSRWAEANRPRENVTWYQAIAFCRWLDHHCRAAGWIEAEAEIVLPHEYEWEVAARYAGKGRTDRRAYPWGRDAISAEYANYYDTGLGQTSAVCIFPAGRQSELNLYDLSGNVWEWCRNKYEDPRDEQVDQSGARRTLRGGSWYDGSTDCRVACRPRNRPNNRNTDNGVRCLVHRPLSQAR